MAHDCPVCLSAFHIERLRVFPGCGHAVCTKCLESIKDIAKNAKKKPLCPTCRKPFEPSKVVQLFLSDPSQPSQYDSPPPEHPTRWRDYSTRVQDRIKTVTECIGKVGRKTEDVRRAGKEVEALADVMQKDRESVDVVQTLLRAVAQFTERIAPVFAEVTLYNKLRSDLQSVQKEMKQLQTLYEDAANAAAVAKDMLHAEQGKNLQLSLDRNTFKEESANRLNIMKRFKTKEQKQSARIENLESQVEDREAMIKELKEQLRLERYSSSQTAVSEYDDEMEADIDGVLLVENSSETEYDYHPPSPPPPPRRGVSDHRQPPVRKPSFGSGSDWNIPKKPRVPDPGQDINAVMSKETLGLDSRGKTTKGANTLGSRKRPRNELFE